MKITTESSVSEVDQRGSGYRMGGNVNTNDSNAAGVTVVLPSQTFKDGDHGFTRYWGICSSVCRSVKLSMAYGRLEPGVEASAHAHNVETAIFIVSGAVRVLYGKTLEHFQDAFEGCFVHIPASVMHKPVLLSNSPMEYIVARDLPTPD